MQTSLSLSFSGRCLALVFIGVSLMTVLGAVRPLAAAEAEEAKAEIPDIEAKTKAIQEKLDLVDPTYKDVAYGPHERQNLNFWRSKSSKPSPVLVKIHGDNWGAGRKGQTVGAHMLKGGVSYCEIDYRLAPPNMIPIPLMDAARAIQFLRYKADEWNINPDKIVVQGGSAGGASSLWLAFHDDLADPESKDPIARQSSRVAGAIAIGAPTTLDPFVIEERIGPAALKHPMIWRTSGAKSYEELKQNWERYKKNSLECSAVTHVTRDDPPVYLKYALDTPTPLTEGDGIHHAEFGRILKEKCDAVGVPCTLLIFSADPKPAQSSAQYMKEIFGQ